MWKPRILVVEDELMSRELYYQILKNDYDVILIGNGGLAIDYVNNNPVDVALVDIKIPDVDGIEVLKQVKEIHPKIEVIMITGYASIENAKNAIKYGAIDYLIKPTEVKEIQSTVKKAVAKRIQRMQYDEKLSGLLQVSQSIVSSLESEDVKRSILNWVEKLFQTRMVWLSLYNSQSGKFELAEVREPTLKGIADVFSDAVEEITASVLAQKQITIASDTMTDRMIRNTALESEIKSIVGLPLMIEDKVIGVLGFSSPQFEDRQSIETTEMNFLTIFANHAAIALENARLYSDLKDSEQKLQNSLEQTTASLAEKEVLLREVHHRVKNNLQIISSLLDMSIMQTNNQEAIDFGKEVYARIHTMSLIHSQLYQSDNFNKIDMEKHIHELVDFLAQIYATREKTITSVIEKSDATLSITQAIPCAVVLNELLSNAFKHAFKNKSKGTIEISIKRSSDETLLIGIKDDGIGIPEDIDINSINSLGFKLVRNLVKEQLKGKIRLERNDGTEFIIEFPILRE
ncbi:MAG: response regulator [Candidatus Poribacteria bacterium]